MSTSVVQIRGGKARLNKGSIGSRKEESSFPWSASRLKMLLQCPRQFRFAYLDGLPRATTAPLVFGQVVHEVIKCAHEVQMRKGDLPPVGEMLERFDALWNQAMEGEVLFRPSHPTSARYTTMGHEMLRVFHTVNRESVPPLMVELPFEVEVETRDGTVLLRGIIDRVNEVRGEDGQAALVIVDYKSGSRKIKPEEVRNDLQLTVYALAVEGMLALPVERVEFHWLRDGWAMSAARDEDALSHLTDEVLPFASRTLAQGQFAPTPGYWCRWCDFVTPCQQEGGVSHGLCR